MGYEDLPLTTFDDKHLDALVQRVAAHGASLLRDHRAGSPSPQRSRACSRQPSERRPLLSTAPRRVTDLDAGVASSSSDGTLENSLLDSFAANMAALRGELEVVRAQREADDAFSGSADASAAASSSSSSEHSAALPRCPSICIEPAEPGPRNTPSSASPSRSSSTSTSTSSSTSSSTPTSPSTSTPSSLLTKLPLLSSTDARALVFGADRPAQKRRHLHGSCTVDGACRRDVWLRGLVGLASAGAVLLLC